MNLTDIATIENTLEINLPGYFRRAVAAGLLSGLLNSDACSVIAINRAFRSGEFGDEEWPSHVCAFADDGGGNFYCIDLSSNEDRVLLRDHETLRLDTEADSFSEWIRGQQ